MLLAQGSPGPLHAGLDTLYGGDFARAAAYFDGLSAQHPADPAPLVFQAAPHLWWALALDSADFALQRIDSLHSLEMARGRALPVFKGDFWLATQLAHRARQREE